MRALCNREGLLTAFTMVSGVVPARSPKPILQNVKLSVADDEGSVLMGTDLEVGIRHRVLGVKIEEPGSVILPTAADRVDSADGRRRGADARDDRRAPDRPGAARVEFKLPMRRPRPLPRGSRFRRDQLSCDLRRQPQEADPPDDVRHRPRQHPVRPGRGAGGADGREPITMVGTDGRRLARMIATAEAENDAAGPVRNPGDPGQGPQADRAEPRRRRPARPSDDPVGDRRPGPDRAGP